MARLQEENKVSKENGEKEIKEMQIAHAVEMALLKANVKNDKAMSAVKALLNLDDIEFDESGIKGLDKQIEDLKADEAVSALFAKTEESVKLKGLKPAEGSNELPKGKEVDAMNYEELCAYMETNPDAQI